MSRTQQPDVIKPKPSVQPGARRDARPPVAPVSERERWRELQHGLGNQAVSHMLHREIAATGVAAAASAETQTEGTKCPIGEPGDAFEQEADRVAEQVMSAPPLSAAGNAPPLIQRMAGGSPVRPRAVPASVDQALAGPGTPLEPDLRGDMERHLGQDFSRVRVHSGGAADRSAREVNAHAFTVGHDIVFGAARFAPGTHEGRRLIAHELTHVVQQAETRMPHLQRQVISHTQIPQTSRFSEAISGLGKSIDYRIETFQVTEADLSDPKVTAGLRSLSNDQLRAYLDRTSDDTVRSYILGILAVPEFDGPAPIKLLAPAAAVAAAADVTTRFDEDSIRTLEHYSARTPDGVFDADDAQALANLQQALQLTPTGKADEALLNALLKLVGPASGARSAMIHLVVNYARLGVSGALAIVYVPGLGAASDVDPFPGGVSTIQIGNPGFASYSVMVAEIRTQLATQPAAAVVTAVPATVLADAAQQQHAIAVDKKRIKDQRSIRLLQGTLGSNVSAQWDVELVRHLAAKQQALGLTPDGVLDQTTLAAIGTEMIADGAHDAVLQVIVDYYDLDRSHTFNIVFDPNPPNSTADAQTFSIGGSGTPGIVHVYPLAFGQPFEGLVHTLAHELGHIQQVVQGIASRNVREFLSEGIEIESKGMRMEAIESDADIDLMLQSRPPAHPGFIQDAQAMLHWWTLMTPDEQRAHHQRFRDLRSIIINRIVIEGTESQQSKLGPFVIRLYDADAGIP